MLTKKIVVAIYLAIFITATKTEADIHKIFSFMRDHICKTDEEKQVTKELADWIPLLDFHVQEKANLHAFLVEILTFVQDAARARVDTIDLYIQAKQIQINIDNANKSIIGSNNNIRDLQAEIERLKKVKVK